MCITPVFIHGIIIIKQGAVTTFSLQKPDKLNYVNFYSSTGDLNPFFKFDTLGNAYTAIQNIFNGGFYIFSNNGVNFADLSCGVPDAHLAW